MAKNNRKSQGKGRKTSIEKPAPKIAARRAAGGLAKVSAATDTVDFLFEWDGGKGELVALYDGDALQVSKVTGNQTIEGTYTTPVKQRHNVGWALILGEPATNLRLHMGKNGADLQLLETKDAAQALWQDDASLE
jgi:hypothetical protein